MATKTLVTGEVEIRLVATGIVWFADVEAQGADHLRIRLRPDTLGVLPTLVNGTTVTCAMGSPDGRYYLNATVLEQKGPILWLRIAMGWSRTENRQAPRISGGFPVSYQSNNAEGIAACMDVSVGGMRLRMVKALPVRTHINMCYKLPGEQVPMRSEGYVIYLRPAEEPGKGLDVGVKIQGLTPKDFARIRRYCIR